MEVFKLFSALILYVSDIADLFSTAPTAADCNEIHEYRESRAA
jgi:hypothetical protein